VKSQVTSHKSQEKPQVHSHRSQVKILFFILLVTFGLVTMDSYADTIYLKGGTTDKGLVVEEDYDRLVFNTPDGEREILKADTDDVFFDEPYQNNLYLGRRAEDSGDFDGAFQFYKLALQSNPDFKMAEDAIKGLEDAKWRFKKSWRYRELKETMKAQLGIVLGRVSEKIVINALAPDIAGEIEGGQFSNRELSPLVVGDAIISCWARPVTYAGLKNTSKFLIGLSNTILKVVIERDIKIEKPPSLKLFSPLIISMEYEGPTVGSVKKDNYLYKAGLRASDLIVKINGDSTRYMKLAKLKRKLLHGSKDRVLTIRREVMLMRKRPESKLANAMWAWHSKEVLLDEAKGEELLNFCKDKNIGILFFQLQYQFIDRGQFSKRELSPTVVCRLLYETKLRAFLKDAHSRGITVYALDGSPGFCLETGHPLVLAQINAILGFNKKAKGAQERFDGIHYDNEPYLLPAYNSNLKEAILSQFLSLHRKCKELINSNGAKLEYGIDIPFWFDGLDSLDRKLIDICDDVGIMDYRNFAAGPDGITAHALDKLKYAAAVKKKVFVGVETSEYPQQEAYFISALTEAEFNNKAPGILNTNRFEDFILRTHLYNGKVYIGLVRPQGANEENFKKALSKLMDSYGRIQKPAAKEELDNLAFDIMQAISSNPEFRDVRYEEYNGAAGAASLAFIAKEIILEKLTFATFTEKDMDAVLAEARREFESYPSFAGFAIHHYRSYKELCDRK